jgi:hypothetical protein
MAISFKSNQQNLSRLQRALVKEVETMGRRNSDWVPQPQYKGQLAPIPISSTPMRAVVMAIPETNSHFLMDRGFIQFVRNIQQTNRVIVRVVPVRGWRK